MLRRAAITLVEILVVLAIIGIVIALLLPARQAARYAAREAARPAASLESFSGGRLVNDAFSQPQEQSQAGEDLAVVNVPRKIIYQAELTLVVEQISNTETEIARLVKENGGYVAEANVNRTEGELLSGRWRVRVPTDRFDHFIEAVAKLGVVESRQQTSQDVTEQFVDLEAQISNKKRLEERIVAVLDNAQAQIKDVLEVERELARVRGEIEQMEGRLRYLTNRTDLTTVSIVAREVRDYVPPAALSLTARIRQAWDESLRNLRTFGERVLVATVFSGPWLGILMVLIIPTWYVTKRIRAR